MAKRKAFNIPIQLRDLIANRRIIPFIGAGFSAGLGLPEWEEMLQNIAEDMNDDLTFEQVKKYCNGDFLQIAEYYLIRSDRRIGPIRQALSTGLSSTNVNLTSSAVHTEIINLGAPQVYTTNYDEFIEKAYKQHRQEFTVIALPKDVATATSTKTQIVKYHGDLRHENTLVLTESSYYARLDFESPMDLKFRSDILGKSVLFLGYSFRDINIRIIWFKLMRMMRDVSPEDRVPSYIVTLAPNPVLAALYRDVGIETIVLDPDCEAKTKEEKTALLADFLFQLGAESSLESRIPGSGKPMIVSSALVQKAAETAADRPNSLQESVNSKYYSMLESRKIPFSLRDTIVSSILLVGTSSKERLICKTKIGIGLIRDYGTTRELAIRVIRSLCNLSARDIVLSSQLNWPEIFTHKLDSVDVEYFIGRAEAELKHRHNGIAEPDIDLAYYVDILRRCLLGEIAAKPTGNLSDRITDLIKAISKIYKSADTYPLGPPNPPNPAKLIEEIRRAMPKQSQADLDDDLPF